jgi:SAM-dependent methyltransferase
MFKTTINTESLNWLMPHIQVVQISRYSSQLGGTLLDIGCGKKPYKNIFNCKNYIGLESAATLHGLKEVDLIGNALLLPFKNESFDSVVSFQVMEHIPEPEIFLKEIFRVLKNGGKVIMTSPFMWGEHESPYDFYRYTRFGLKYLSEKAGFTVRSIDPQSKYWTMAMLRFNYYVDRFMFGPLKYIAKPFFILNQLIAMTLDKFPHNYTCDTVGFTTFLVKENKN